jgi:hypothetical protein
MVEIIISTDVTLKKIKLYVYVYSMLDDDDKSTTHLLSVDPSPLRCCRVQIYVH